MTKKQLGAAGLLLIATLIWGASFILMKDALDALPTFWLLAIRFCSASVLLGLIFFKRLRTLRPSDFGAGAVIGGFIFLAYVFQTFGLAHTTPGKNAFLTAVYCVMIPFIWWIMTKKRPSVMTFAAAGICMAGIGLISLESGFSLGLGDGLTMVGGSFFAFHIVAVTKLSRDRDVLALTVLQFFFAGIYSLAGALIFEKPPTEFSLGVVLNLGYLCVFATAVALLFQNIGQKYLPPTLSSILISLESVFGAVFSFIFGYEAPDLRTIIGFVLIFAAVALAQIGSSEKSE